MLTVVIMTEAVQLEDFEGAIIETKTVCSNLQ